MPTYSRAPPAAVRTITGAHKKRQEKLKRETPSPHQLCGAQLQQARVQLPCRGVVLGVPAVSEAEDRESHGLQTVPGQAPALPRNQPTPTDRSGNIALKGRTQWVGSNLMRHGNGCTTVAEELPLRGFATAYVRLPFVLVHTTCFYRRGVRAAGAHIPKFRRGAGGGGGLGAPFRKVEKRDF